MQARPGLLVIRFGKEVLRRLETQVLKSTFVREAWHAYRSSAVAQAVVANTTLLFGLVLLDLVLGLPPAGRMLYAIPVFSLTRVAGVRLGVALGAVATIVGTVLDRRAGFSDAWLLNFVVRMIAFTVVAFKVEHMVDRLKITTDAAMHDALTGALNRLGFVQAAEPILRDALLDEEEMVLAVIDLNDFKLVNDLYGHAFGDRMLKTLVDCLTPAVAQGGIIGRTGGDEFQILFKGDTKEGVQLAILRALNRFSDATLVLGHRSTFSYGVAGLRTDGTTLEALLQCADARMYRHKGSKPLSPFDRRHAVAHDTRRVQSA